MALADAVPFATAHWTFDENSGNRVDTIGGLVLAENPGTIGSAAAQFGNGVSIDIADSEFLQVAHEGGLVSTNTSWMWRFWFSLKSKTAIRALISTWNGGDHEILTYYDDVTDEIQCAMEQVAGGALSVATSGYAGTSVNTRKLIHLWYDHANQIFGVSVNAGTPVTVAATNGFAENNISNPPLQVGKFTTGGAFFSDALFDDFVILNGYVLDAAERTADHNGGTGVAFLDWAAGGSSSVSPSPSPSVSPSASVSPSSSASPSVSPSASVSPSSSVSPSVSPSSSVSASPSPSLGIGLGSIFRSDVISVVGE